MKSKGLGKLFKWTENNRAMMAVYKVINNVSLSPSKGLPLSLIHTNVCLRLAGDARERSDCGSAPRDTTDTYLFTHTHRIIWCVIVNNIVLTLN